MCGAAAGTQNILFRGFGAARLRPNAGTTHAIDVEAALGATAAGGGGGPTTPHPRRPPPNRHALVLLACCSSAGCCSVPAGMPELVRRRRSSAAHLPCTEPQSTTHNAQRTEHGAQLAGPAEGGRGRQRARGQHVVICVGGCEKAGRGANRDGPANQPSLPPSPLLCCRCQRPPISPNSLWEQ